MKRAVVAVVVLAAAFLGYRHYDKSYSPVQHYKKFAEQILHRQYDAASELTDGIAAKVARRDLPMAVCDKTAAKLSALRRPDLLVTGPTWFYDGGGCC